ncbi:MAG: hypothetical protein H6825_06145 [Planctomycetes bacterium]|nr:hypothetical protein [Planctomycetota bacterium]
MPDPDTARIAEARSPISFAGLPLSTVSYVLLFLATLDAWITDHLLRTDFGREVNPLMNWLHESGGRLTFVFAKFALTALCLLWMNRRAPPRYARMAVIAAFAIYVPVTLLNLFATSTLPT